MTKKQSVWKFERARRPLAAIALVGAVAVSLQGCMSMAVGGAVMGTLAATDRRTFGAQAEDKAITLKGESRISGLVNGAGQVDVSSFNRRVLLTGEVRDEAMKANVEREIAAIENVESVVNELAIGGATSFAARSNDALITGKVKASFVDTRDLYANSIKVVTERGIVYLMGRVTPREGQVAAHVASGVSGVRKVVKIFEYIGDQDLQQMAVTPDSAAKQ